VTVAHRKKPKKHHSCVIPQGSSRQLVYTLSEASKPGEALKMVVDAIGAIVKYGVDGCVVTSDFLFADVYVYICV
jgi:uncharacterized linocin/CFP29 family protein